MCHEQGIYLHNKQMLVDSLIGDHLLIIAFRPDGIIFMNVCIVTTVAMLMLLRDFGPYGTTFMTMCVHYFRFSCHS
jgi:hypothetical protein